MPQSANSWKLASLSRAKRLSACQLSASNSMSLRRTSGDARLAFIMAIKAYTSEPARHAAERAQLLVPDHQAGRIATIRIVRGSMIKISSRTMM
jgi:hypothetical protein